MSLARLRLRRRSFISATPFAIMGTLLAPTLVEAASIAGARVRHRSNPDLPRPGTTEIVTWFGKVRPANAAVHDEWVVR